MPELGVCLETPKLSSVLSLAGYGGGGVCLWVCVWWGVGGDSCSLLNLENCAPL